ncbi:hypothetical protein TI39_contig5817g00009 [Zymoseptoria brevis]|uniref:Uncharacterized protein n=1 Tax=Zymoseptoria brevis TaxID=1047168 RepID=A0A0F4G688_9PEZI|nr:hypothetical protein TI39_contig5817g00009 [Zymoseptoria brevis]
MSDSDPTSVGLPADTEIEDCLRVIVRLGVKNEEEITVNKARQQAEKELGLDDGFLKNDAKWKAKSKSIITDTMQEDDEEDEEPSLESPDKPGAETPEKSPPKAKARPAAKAGKKRKSDDAPSARTKRRKTAESDDEASESFGHGCEEDEVVESKEDSANDSDSFAEDATPAKPNKRKAPAKQSKVQKKPAEKKSTAKATKGKPTGKKSTDTIIDDSNSESEAPAKSTAAKAARKKPTSDPEEDTKAESKSTGDASELSDPPANISDNAPNAGHPIASDNESEMSILIDDPPPKKKRNSKASASEPKAKATKSSTTASKKKGEPLSKNEEEIKRLQGWLVKCGIRKLWHRELASCDTEKAKVQHLKKMLEDAGMEGRPSNEKAKSIKEARELQEEIEAAKEFEKKWGQGKDDDGTESEGDGDDDDGPEEDATDENKAGAKPKRVLPKGFVDFGDSGDESE